ncbi:NAD-dependent epimerase/dehydratase family protein [Cohnella herbarum]|uniref:NAD-dependent epimerase/dehydratase family protein n=1 Tax=Cohnella herbarum TaxID=2728023 RepID=A0A7Z2VIX9_9BACL|nr:NAD-dependent epimerase/dehydratase family protein [Cohnella herbarum]QJD84058.1 NAD-dependent epimerase/dehydratase family protein [Cohnella herbarum]
MRVIVTGGAGFIGSRLVHALVGEGHETIAIDNLSMGDAGRLPAGVKLYKLQVEAPETTEWISRLRPGAVFHLAAQVGMGSSLQAPSEDGLSNVIGTLRVLEGCRQAGSKLVFSSTSGVYGESKGKRLLKETSPKLPFAPYGLSKWTAEEYIRKSGDWWGGSYTILRYANVYGPGQTARGEGGVVACFMARIRDGLPLVIHGDGEQSRDFVHVDDIVKANLAALERGDGEVCNIGTGVATSVNRLADCCERLSGSGSLGRIYEPSRNGDVRCSRLSSARAESILGWKPSIPLELGLSRLLGGMNL